ncbi:MAG TPA: protein kinase, partial [Pirellulales bacterium]
MASTEDLIVRMRRNQLLTTEQLAKVSQAAGAFTPDQLLQRLVQSNWLTKWQAVQLLRGGGPLRLADYVLREHVARGTEAEIFRATDLAGVQVALKVWPTGFFRSTRERDQLRRAVDAAKAVRHPALVPTRAAGFDRTRDFIVSEFVDGTNLEVLLQERGRLPYQLVCDCIRQAALGLDAAAQLGVTHGRLQPSKLMLLRQEPGRPPRMRVLGTGVDQSVSRDLGGSTIMTGSQLPGGSDYMAPELAMDPGGAKSSSDVYSLGGVLFHLIAGCLAFEGQTQLQVWKERFEAAPRKLRKFVGDVPVALETLISRTLATDPDERLSTYAELIAGLDEVLHAAATASTTSGASAARTRDDDGGRKAKSPSIAVESRVYESDSPSGNVASLKEPPSRRIVRFTGEVEEYLSRLIDFGLLTKEQVEELREASPREIDANALFNGLIERRWLTEWQSNELRARRTQFKIGPYTLVGRITTEGKVTVYKAADAQRGFVRLKVVPSGHAVDQENIARLDRERRVAARAAHPSLLRFVDSGRTDDCCWLALEYFSEISLQDLIDRKASVPQAWACEAVARALRAVQALSDRKIYHRDLSPSWVLVGRDDFVEPPDVRVWGFGRVHSHDSAVKGGTVTNPEDLVGNADYMAPEQAVAPREVDGRSDVYAMASILFHTLAGRPPFDGDSPFEKIDIRAKADPPKLSWLRSDVSRDLEFLILKMMARDPAQRHKSPAEAAKALDPFSMTGGATSTSSIVSASPTTQAGNSPGPNEPRPPQTVEDFFTVARESGLLTGERLNEARRAVRELKSPQLAGNRLADEGQFTRWQVKRLLEGRRDFRIGRWTLLDELGDGATTVTYLANDSAGRGANDPPVAVKVLTPDAALESEHVARFHRGGRLAGALSHPNIVRLLESNQDAGRHFHAMEYVRGRTLRDWLKTLRAFPIPLACECVRQTALGLQHAHENGVVHRDVRPGHL